MPVVSHEDMLAWLSTESRALLIQSQKGEPSHKKDGSLQQDGGPWGATLLCLAHSMRWVLRQRGFVCEWSEDTLLRKCCNPHFFQMWGWVGFNICHQIHSCKCFMALAIYNSDLYRVSSLYEPRPCLRSLWYVSLSWQNTWAMFTVWFIKYNKGSGLLEGNTQCVFLSRQP